MTEPGAVDHQSPRLQELASPDLSTRVPESHPAEPQSNLHGFEPIFTLITNTSDATTHHPQVRYIFSDDDPEILTQALAECEASASKEGSDNRAMMLDLAPDEKGGYKISSASSLSPSWAVLNAELSQISPPSSDGGNGGGSRSRAGNDAGDEATKRTERLILRVDGVESAALGSEVDMALSDEQSRQSSGSRSGISGISGVIRADGPPPGQDNVEDYNILIEDFQKRLSMLRKVVDTGEERRSKRGVTVLEGDATHATQDATSQAETEAKKPSD